MANTNDITILSEIQSRETALNHLPNLPEGFVFGEFDKIVLGAYTAGFSAEDISVKLNEQYEAALTLVFSDRADKRKIGVPENRVINKTDIHNYFAFLRGEIVNEVEWRYRFNNLMALRDGKPLPIVRNDLIKFTATLLEDGFSMTELSNLANVDTSLFSNIVWMMRLDLSEKAPNELKELLIKTADDFGADENKSIADFIKEVDSGNTYASVPTTYSHELSRSINSAMSTLWLQTYYANPDGFTSENISYIYNALEVYFRGCYKTSEFPWSLTSNPSGVEATVADWFSINFFNNQPLSGRLIHLATDQQIEGKPIADIISSLLELINPIVWEN